MFHTDDSLYIYCIAPNFWGTKFSWIGLLQHFLDWGFSLTTKIIQSSLEACQSVKIIRRTLYSLLFQLLKNSWPQSAIASFFLRLASSWKLLSPSSQTISHPPEKPSLTFLEGKTVWFDRTINYSSKLSCTFLHSHIWKEYTCNAHVQ